MNVARSVLCFLAIAGHAYATELVVLAPKPAPVHDASTTTSVLWPPTRVRYRGDKLKRFQRYLGTKFPRWAFHEGTVRKGTFTILQYEPFSAGGVRGTDITVLYDDGISTPWTQYSWIQLVFTTDHVTRKSSAKVDNIYSNFPFYANYTPIGFKKGLFTNDYFQGPSIWWDKNGMYPTQSIQNPTGRDGATGVLVNKTLVGDLLFTDEPYRESKHSASVDFYLLLVKFTWNGKDLAAAGGQVWICDGIHWGYRIRPKQ